MMDPQEILQNGINTLQLKLPPESADKILHYLGLLSKWNRKYNLTSVHDMENMILRHALDCLSIVPHVRGRRVLDVGTGAGLPGLMLALARPEWHCVLLDSNAKKTRFVTQALIELNLDNVQVECRRLEDFQPAALFNTVTARAYSNVPQLYRQTCGLCAEDGRLLVMKGVLPVAELAELDELSVEMQALPLHVPGLDAQRHVMIVHPCREAVEA